MPVIEIKDMQLWTFYPFARSSYWAFILNSVIISISTLISAR